MTKDFVNRRPAGTPTGGQFAPTNRPISDGLGLVDDEPDTGIGEESRTVVVRPRDLDDVVIIIETALGDDSRDSNESAFWDDSVWRDHLASLLERAYETSSVETDGGEFSVTVGRARRSAKAAMVEDGRTVELVRAPGLAHGCNCRGVMGAGIATSFVVCEL
ncbi:MAG: hypothetical protein ACYCR4_14120 [Acidimicrobiales bacterium]